MQKIMKNLMALAPILFALSAPFTLQAIAEETEKSMSLAIDQTAQVKFDQAPSTIIIGNPSIAHGQKLENGQVFLMGRSFGVTNLLAFDRDGNQMADIKVHVLGSQPSQVSLHKGADRWTYACLDTCESHMEIGDNHELFKELAEQMELKSGQAKGAN